MSGRIRCSRCSARIRVAPDGTETIRTVNGSVPHQHRKPYALREDRPEDLEPDKHDWYPGRTR
jgi:hypothetical protein